LLGPGLPLWAVRPVQSLSACTVQLYLYSPYGPYGLYRVSVPVQYSYTSTPPMGLTACTEPQCLYSTAIPLLPLWALRPVQNLSACTRVHFIFLLYCGIMGPPSYIRSFYRNVRYEAHGCSGISHFQYICIYARFDILTAALLQLWCCRAMGRGDW